MTEIQIQLAYIALSIGTLLFVALLAWVAYLKKEVNKYAIKYKHLLSVTVDLQKDIEKLNKDSKRQNIIIIHLEEVFELLSTASKEFQKFMKLQKDENAAIYNAFRGNHNETLTKLEAILKTNVVDKVKKTSQISPTKSRRSGKVKVEKGEVIITKKNK